MLLLAAEGLTDKEIARHLGLSQRTIGTYWERMRLKLGPFSRTQLVARFLRSEADGDSDGVTYRSLFASWHEGIWILSLGGETIFANRFMASLFGFPPDDFRDAEARALFESATSLGVDAAVAQCLHEPRHFELGIARPNGSVAWLNVTGSAVRDPKGRCSAVVFLAQDRTSQKRIQHTLLASESALAFLIDQTSDYVARFDANLVCIFMNPALRALAGEGASDAIGQPIERLEHLFRPVQAWKANLAAAYEAGETRRFDSGLDGEDGSLATVIRPVPSPDLTPATLLTVTKRKG